jgi:glycine cleavage system H protein
MQGDIFATKGAEYLIVIAYLVLLVVMVRWLTPRASRAAGAVARRPGTRPAPWFALVGGRRYHQGHSWASDEAGDVVTVGLDDFAARLLGPPDGFSLPAIGAPLLQGEPGWVVRGGGRELPMVSPVGGTVIAVNDALAAAPGLAAEDPYDRGWLLKVRAPNRRAALRNLLAGDLASAWMQQAAERLRRLSAGGLGEVMPDGGMPVQGFGRALGQEEWETVARECFLAD